MTGQIRPEGKKQTVHVKASMRAIDRGSLSEHEIKRCRAAAKGLHWEVWEEDILWWSTDRTRWEPMDATDLSRRRRWLMVETETGFAAALIWDIEDALRLPSAEEQPKTLPERQRV